MEKNETKDGLSSSKPYLKDVIDVAAFKKGRANLVIAPCHSGKTTAAAKIIEAHASIPERVLFLIDTTAGRDAIAALKSAKPFTQEWMYTIDPAWWTGDPDDDRFVVMTYHQFGYKIEESPTFIFGLDLIICDEMHNLIKYRGIENSNNKRTQGDESVKEQRCCQNALNAIAAIGRARGNAPLLVIMTATGNAVSEFLDAENVPVKYFDYTDQVHSDATLNRIYYSDISQIIGNIQGRAIVYVSRVKMMEEFAKAFDDGQRRICCLWSPHYAKKMNDEQLAVRKSILETKRIPPEIDVLILNAAYETSINITNEDFRTMIIHDKNPDTQIQVRGRIRHDIDTLYLHDDLHVNTAAQFPEEYLGRFLKPSEVREIATSMNLKNENGRLLMWNSIWPMLQRDGMMINKEKKNGERGWRIHRLPS